MFFFFLKKIVARILFPMPLALMLLVAGLLLTVWKAGGNPRRTRCRRMIGVAMIAAGILIFGVGGFFGRQLLQCYSGGNPPLSARQLGGPGVSRVICVTSAGAFAMGEVEVDERRIHPESRARLDEGCRLYTECRRAGIPCRLVVSMPGRGSNPVRCAAVRAACARCGIAPEEVFFVEGVLDSRGEVRRFAEFPGQLVLVSRASHLPRLLRLARSLGRSDSLASPYDLVAPIKVDPLTFVPSAENFAAFEELIYELLGQAELILFH